MLLHLPWPAVEVQRLLEIPLYLQQLLGPAAAGDRAASVPPAVEVQQLLELYLQQLLGTAAAGDRAASVPPAVEVQQLLE